MYDRARWLIGEGLHTMSTAPDWLGSLSTRRTAALKILPSVIEKILAHLNNKASSAGAALLPEGRGPPQARLGVPDSSIESRMLSSLCCSF